MLLIQELALFCAFLPGTQYITILLEEDLYRGLYKGVVIGFIKGGGY